MIGLLAGSIGTRRILKLFEKYNIKASWFIPGHSLEYGTPSYSLLSSPLS